MDFRLPAELASLQTEARAVAAASARELEFREQSWIAGFSREFALELGTRGWLGMTIPAADGGHGRSRLERFVVTEAMIEAGAPVAASWVGDRQIGPTLAEYGSTEQKQRFVPDIVAGRTCWSIGLSEPDAGSDLAAVRTRAVRDGAHWRIDGSKIWTSFADEADFVYLVTRTDPDAPAHRGMSEIIVPLDSPGVTATPIVDMLEERHFCEVTFDDVRVPVENLVGELNGSWRQVMRQLEHERAGIDRLLSNVALFHDVCDRADRADPIVRQEIAALEIGLRIGRLLVIRETVGQAPAGFSAATKVFCTELEQRIADFISRVDPMVMIAGRTARAVCYAPAYTIQGGTSNVLRNVLGERLLGLPR